MPRLRNAFQIALRTYKDFIPSASRIARYRPARPDRLQLLAQLETEKYSHASVLVRLQRRVRAWRGQSALISVPAPCQFFGKSRDPEQNQVFPSATSASRS